MGSGNVELIKCVLFFPGKAQYSVSDKKGIIGFISLKDVSRIYNNTSQVVWISSLVPCLNIGLHVS